MIKIILIFIFLLAFTKQSEFETDIFWNFLQSKPSENIFYSPFSLELAVAMAYEGSENKTKSQISQAFNFNLNKTLQRNDMKNLLKSINSSQSKMRKKEEEDIKYFKQYQPSVDTSTIPNSYFYLRAANSIWPDINFQINSTYVSRIQNYYDGEVNLLDYQQPEKSREKINIWVENKTEDKIKNLLAKGTINKATKLVIVNALYFKAAWQNEFQVEQTTEETFYLENGDTQKVKMMKQSGYFNYYENKVLKIIELPFKNNQASFYIVMPITESIKLKELQSSFDQNQFINLQKQMKSAYIKKLWLPKFKIETQMSLTKQLEQLGIKDAFNATKANFQSISKEKIFISDIIQKTYIDVEETGVEAAAATAMTFETTSMPSEEQSFIANKPFIFCIQFNQEKANLFIGAIKSLESETEKEEKSHNSELVDEFEPQISEEINITEQNQKNANLFSFRMVAFTVLSLLLIYI